MRLSLTLLALISAPAMAQQQPPSGPPRGETVFDETWVTIGVGAGYSPS